MIRHRTLVPDQLELAKELAQSDRIDEAEAILENIVNNSPATPAAFAGSARMAMHKKDWGIAAARWQRAIFAFPDTAKPQWRESLVKALYFDGKLKEADQASIELERWSTPSPSLRHVLTRLLAETHQFQRLLAKYRSGHWLTTEPGPADFLALRKLARLEDIGEARELYDSFVHVARSGESHLQLLKFIGPLFDKEEKWNRWLGYSERLQKMIADEKDESKRQTLIAARLVTAIAMCDRRQLAQIFDTYQGTVDTDTDEWLGRIRQRLKDLNEKRPTRQKVFGIGLSRTGTTSLTAALRQLGYSAVHYINPLTGDLLSSNDFDLFDAFTDISISYRFEALSQRYPEAKFIHTKRSKQAWIRSVTRLYQEVHGINGVGELRRYIDNPRKCVYGERFCQIADNLYCRHGDFASAYEAHEKRVWSHFSGERRHQLLEMDIPAGDGWSKLCSYLGELVPQSPFPWENKMGSIAKPAF